MENICELYRYQTDSSTNNSSTAQVLSSHLLFYEYNIEHVPPSHFAGYVDGYI